MIPLGRDEPRINGPLPGPRAAAWLERDHRVMSPSYTRTYPLVVHRAFGAMVEDVDGNRFLDFTAGIAVTNVGHSHPKVVAAIRKQSQRLIHMSGTDFYYAPQVRLGERLAALAPGPEPKRVFFTNSGAEAIEAALKLAAPSHGSQSGAGVHERLSRSDLWRALAQWVEAVATPRFLSAGSRHPSCTLRRPGQRQGSAENHLPGGGACGDLRRARSRGGGIHRPAARVPAGPAPALRRAWRPAGPRRDSERHRADGQDVRLRALGRGGRHRLPGQGHRQRASPGCHRRQGLGDGLAQREPCLDVRWQPGRLRGVAGDPAIGREPLSRQCRPARP